MGGSLHFSERIAGGLLHFSIITINLGVFNLLPFPALDGGKIVFLLIEAVTGHAVPEKIQGSLTVAAFALLFGPVSYTHLSPALCRVRTWVHWSTRAEHTAPLPTIEYPRRLFAAGEN